MVYDIFFETSIKFISHIYVSDLTQLMKFNELGEHYNDSLLTVNKILLSQ